LGSYIWSNNSTQLLYQDTLSSIQKSPSLEISQKSNYKNLLKTLSPFNNHPTENHTTEINSKNLPLQKNKKIKTQLLDKTLSED
jgi:hypothetical protein